MKKLKVCNAFRQPENIGTYSGKVTIAAIPVAAPFAAADLLDNDLLLKIFK